MKIIDKVISTIEKNGLIQQNDKILAGLSGGADSSALLHILHTLAEKYNAEIYAAHINHNMRETADRDMKFCEELCGRLGIEIFVKSADVPAYAKKNSLSGEEAGRIIRYKFFEEISALKNIDKIATAHNMNDCAETIFMNFIRGSGLGGLMGIPYKRGNIIRPVLDLSREEIERYCAENSIGFMTDETNFKPVYTRNKLRLELIPYIEKNINSNFMKRIVENSDIISEENDFMEKYCGNIFNKASGYKDGIYYLDSAELSGCHTAVIRRVLMMYFRRVYNTPKNIGSGYISDAIALMRGQSGKYLDFPGNMILKNDYGILYVTAKNGKKENTYKEPRIVKTYDQTAKKPSKDAIFIKPEYAEKIYLRTRKDGDIFFPYGMNGRKKLKNFFSDIKLPGSERSSVPLLVSEKDEIIWVVGIRADRRFLADSGDTGVKIEIKYT